MDKECKTDVEETSELVSKEVIKALLEVVEEDDLTPVNNNNKHNNNECEDKVHCNIPGIKPIFSVNNVKLKNTAEYRMVEIVDSFNSNTIKSVKLILSGSTNHMCGIGLFLLVGDRGYCVTDISIRSYIIIKSTLLEKNIKVTETMSYFSMDDNITIHEKKVTFENKLIKKSIE